MRVASRRLRAALEVFEPCFPRKELQAACDEVKALADALGERRDRDVTIAALRGFGGRDGGARPSGIEVADREAPRRAGAGQRGARAPLSSTREALSASLRADGCLARRRRAGEGAAGQEARSRTAARRERGSHRARSPRRAALVRSQGAGPRRGRGAARHADRREAPALRARGRPASASAARPTPPAGGPATSRTCSASIHDCDVMLPRVLEQLDALRAEDAAVPRGARSTPQHAAASLARGLPQKLGGGRAAGYLAATGAGRPSRAQRIPAIASGREAATGSPARGLMRVTSLTWLQPAGCATLSG